MQTNVALPATSSRRKPLFTYKSPTAAEWSTFSPRIPSPKSSSSQAPTPPPVPAPPAKIRERRCKKKKRKGDSLSFKTPLLPLYHPLGRLALSLPPLDPASFGLPPLNYSESENGSGSRSSSRARLDRTAHSPGGQSVAVEVEGVVVPGATTVSAVAAVAAREIKEKEKASPRKRRMGGKRKRKDNDDGDPTYPAKRTRAPRGGHQATAAEDESGNEREGGNGEEGQEEESSAETKKVERRTTRSRRTGMKRRSSSASQTPSPAVQETGEENGKDVEMGKTATPEMRTAEAEGTARGSTRGGASSPEEKEEGELSDDGQV